MREVSMSMPQAEPVAWSRSVGIFNDYVTAKRAIDHLLDRGVSLESVMIVVDGSTVAVDRRVNARRTFASLLGLMVGALVGGGIAASAAATSFAGVEIDWPLAALYGLLIGIVIGGPVGHLLQASVDRERKVPGGNLTREGAFRVVVAAEDFDHAAQLLRARPSQRLGAQQAAPPFGAA